MKKVLLVLAVLGSYVSYAQDKESYLKENIFYTTFESGVGEKVSVRFKLASGPEKIAQTEVYKLWEKETPLLLKKTIQQVPGFPYAKLDSVISNMFLNVEMYLTQATQMASFFTKLGLKSSTSYTPISNSEGFIYVNDKGEVSFSFPFKGQNGYGSMIFAKGYYTEKIKNGKLDTWHAIGN